MSASGAFTFVLHCHLPPTPISNFWQGEITLLTTITETVLPLLQKLSNLRNHNIDFKLTLGLTPIAADYLASTTVLEHLGQYLDAQIMAAASDRSNFADHNPHLHYLADWYHTYYTQLKTTFTEQFSRNLIGILCDLQNAGYVELATSAATYGYLPLLSDTRAINAQLQTAVVCHTRHFGKPPSAIWLPECGYYPGIETLLERYNFRVFFVETHALVGGQPVGVASGDVIGDFSAIKARFADPTAEANPKHDVSTFPAYHAGDSLVAVIGRNNRTGQQVWSANWGYPGDFDYREHNKNAGTSGLKYWRVTGAKTDLAHKDYYHPEWAEYKVEQHAEHFGHLVGDLLRNYHNETGKFGLIASFYPAALFGQRWFEGVAWLGRVLELLGSSPHVKLTTTSEYVESHPPQHSVPLSESSWGTGGQHFIWQNHATQWLWDALETAQTRFQTQINEFQQADTKTIIILNQAARELLLMQSSDWPRMITMQQIAGIDRFVQHWTQFNRLLDSLEAAQPDVVYAQQTFERNPVFQEIDFHWFAR